MRLDGGAHFWAKTLVDEEADVYTYVLVEILGPLDPADPDWLMVRDVVASGQGQPRLLHASSFTGPAVATLVAQFSEAVDVPSDVTVVCAASPTGAVRATVTASTFDRLLEVFVRRSDVR